ncbi:MAG: D-amino acid aminotransferase [Gemmatimonadetes bacterium]|nr:D-amino acid aminotransferase [Gemmatimonadota bacterium]
MAQPVTTIRKVERTKVKAAEPIAYFNGKYAPKRSVKISPDDRGFLFGDGVYEVVRSYGGRIFALEEHVERLRRGLGELRISGFDAGDFVRIAGKLLEENDLADGDALVYMQVTRGAAPRRHAFPTASTAPTLYATATPFEPKGDPARGVAVITQPDTRWARCDIKSVNLLPNCLANQRAQEAGATEAILVRDGVALEGTASSFLTVFNGEVRTAPATNYILPGVTRAVALELCRSAGIPVRETPVYLDELESAEELFLAGTTLELMPIVKLDGQPVGDGRPGPVHRRLYDLFRERVRSGA